jgi:hypothetical protein
MTRCSFLAVVVLALMLGASCQARAPADKPATKKIEEGYFLVYALDSMYQKHPRLPEFGDAILTGPPNREVCLFVHELLQYVAQRRLLFDHLRRYIDKQVAKDKLDAGLLKAFKDYEEYLAAWEKYAKDMHDAFKDYSKKVGWAQQAAAAEVGLTALCYLFGVSDGSATMGEAADALRKQSEASLKKLTAVHLRAWVEYRGKITSAWDDIVKQRKLHEETLRTFAKEQASAQDNPFHLVRDAEKALDPRKKADIDDLIDRAHECMQAAEMVPEGAAYNFYRALFCGMAAKLATRAAEKDLGKTGFTGVGKEPPKAAPLARRALDAYLKYEPVDSNLDAEVFHMYLLVYGFNGDTTTAYNALLKHLLTKNNKGAPQLPFRPNLSCNPTFWYDCARVCSIALDKVPKDANRATAIALECLRLAKLCGYDSDEEAKVDPDLKHVRGNAADQFNRLIK